MSLLRFAHRLQKTREEEKTRAKEMRRKRRRANEEERDAARVRKERGGKFCNLDWYSS